MEAAIVIQILELALRYGVPAVMEVVNKWDGPIDVAAIDERLASRPNPEDAFK